jgi:hypothetical protein
MVGAISFEELTPDQIECELVRLEGLVARIRGWQARLIERAADLEMPRIDGARSIVDWTSARLDVARETALDLARVARHDDLDELALGDASFDRVVARCRLVEAGASKELVGDSDGWDIAGVRRLAARHRRVSRTEERQAVDERRLVFEESFDSASMRFWGRLPGREGQLVREVLDALGDTVPRDAAPTRAQRTADALVMLCQGDQPDTQPAATVIVDARLAAPADGEAGVVVLDGPRVGGAALEAILCDGITEVVGIAGDGTPLGIGTASRKIPPKLRRFVMARDGGCVVDGCTSSYRLEVHHVIPASEGGPTDPQNLVTLCWFHHHRVIHGRGYTIDPHSPPGRRRFIRPCRPPPHEPP